MTHVRTMDCSRIFFPTNPANRSLYFGCFLGTLPVVCYILLLPGICNFQESEEFSFLHCTHQLGLLVKVLISHIRKQKNDTHVIRKKSCSFSGNCGTFFVKGDKKMKFPSFQSLSPALAIHLSRERVN